MVRHTVEQCRCHLGIAKHWPFTEAESGGEDGLAQAFVAQAAIKVLGKSELHGFEKY